MKLAQLTNSAADGISLLRRIWLAQEISGKSSPKLAHAISTNEEVEVAPVV